MPLRIANEPTSIELLEFLQLPASYPHRPARIDLKETHISWVFVTDRYAYKLKKPVRFDFLDFSSLEQRRQACEAELRLNRRISPSVYLAVVPIIRTTSGRLALEQEGEAVDWLVKMRRLDDARTLHALLTTQPLAENALQETQAVANHLANFYAKQAPLTVRTSEFQANLRRHIDDNEQQLLSISPTEADQNSIRLVHSSQQRFLVTHQELFDDRVRDGRIVDGHGDLRPEHIYLYRQPLVIDCIEFSAEYRTNDIVDELAFLTMECDRLGGSFVGRQLFDAYARASNDLPGKNLIAFYKSYRACVRAKVAALRSQQQGSKQANSSIRVEHEYLSLAQRYVHDLGPRVVLIVGGLMGSGKSTLAAQLSQLLSANVVSSDGIRQQQQQTDRKRADAYGQGKYMAEARRDTYRAMMDAAADRFARSSVIILDATFSSQQMRDLACQLADGWQAELLQVECVCPREMAMQRIQGRMTLAESPSDARPELYDRQAEEAQPPLTSVPLVHVDTTMALGRQEQTVLECLRTVLAAAHRGTPDEDGKHTLPS